MRARDLGFRPEGTSGPLNAITDVPGVEVGCVTLIEDPVQNGPRPVAARTGVTAILPLGRDGADKSVPGAIFSLNGNGEMTGSHWIRETGAVSGPVMITNTHAVGSVHRGVVDWIAANHPARAAEWLMPIVAETWDGYLNSINEPFVEPEHAGAAIDAATSGPVPEGNAGGGTGMNCYGFKGGNGSASRLVELGGETYTVGVFMQANFGERAELTIQGVPFGDVDVPCPMDDLGWFLEDRQVPGGAGSVIVVVATDAPMIPQQCEALARRVGLGLARTGTTGGHFSGDVFLAFSTANAGVLDSGFPEEDAADVSLRTMQLVPWNRMDLFYTATVQAVEEAVLNAIVAAEDMTGRGGHVSYALPHDLMRDRLAELSPRR